MLGSIDLNQIVQAIAGLGRGQGDVPATNVEKQLKLLEMVRSSRS